MPMRIFMRVDLPAPFSPMRAWTSPGRRLKETALRTRTPGNDLSMSSISRTGEVMLEALKDGRDLYFGDALLHDDGITLVRHKFLGANERVRCTWGQVQIWNADGSFCIGSKDDKKTNVGISYIHVANTHILEQLISRKFRIAEWRSAMVPGRLRPNSASSTEESRSVTH